MQSYHWNITNSYSYLNKTAGWLGKSDPLFLPSALSIRDHGAFGLDGAFMAQLNNAINGSTRLLVLDNTDFSQAQYYSLMESWIALSEFPVLECFSR